MITVCLITSATGEPVRYLPLAPDCARMRGEAVSPYEEPLHLSFTLLTQLLADHGARAVVTGIGGGEMVALSQVEYPRPDPFHEHGPLPWLGDHTTTRPRAWSSPSWGSHRRPSRTPRRCCRWNVRGNRYRLGESVRKARTMGYWGEFVLLRSDRPATAVQPLSRGLCRKGHDSCFGGMQAFGDAWQLLSVYHGLPGATSGTVQQLGEQTGAPALICHVLDSDTGLVHGWSPDGGAWNTWFAPRCAAEYEVPTHICYEDETGMPSTAYQAAWDAAHTQIVDTMPARARQMSAWSAEAGWTPDTALILDALLSNDIPFAQEHFFDLLAAMGAPLPVTCGSVEDHARQHGETG